jgi:hypothetical protein
VVKTSKVKYLVFCLIGIVLALEACSSAPTTTEVELEQKIHPECKYKSSDLELKRSRLNIAAPAEKERMSAELVNEDLQFASWCPATAKSAKAD